MASAKALRITILVLSVLLGLMFLMSGVNKLRNIGPNPDHPTFDEQFVAWGFPAWARFVVGPLEIAAALLLALPRTRFYGAATITALMAGGVPTHLLAGEASLAPFPLVLGLLAGTLAWLTRPAWVRAMLSRDSASTA